MTLGALEGVIGFYFCICCSFHISHLLSETMQKIILFKKTE